MAVHCVSRKTGWCNQITDKTIASAGMTMVSKRIAYIHAAIKKLRWREREFERKLRKRRVCISPIRFSNAVPEQLCIYHTNDREKGEFSIRTYITSKQAAIPRLKHQMA